MASLKEKNKSQFSFLQITYYDVLIIEKWRYNGFEKQLFMDCYHQSYKNGDKPIRGPRGSHGYSVFNKEGQLFGLMEYYFENDGVYLGLGINPIFIGRGFSKDFLLSSLDFLQNNYSIPEPIYICVHKCNIQGVRAYEGAGFKFFSKNEHEIRYIWDKKNCIKEINNRQY